jgi:fluoroquinolone resistance protein
MPATPDVIEEDLTPWTGALESQFDIEDSLVTGSFEDVRAAGGRIRHSRLDRAGLTGARLRSLSLVDVVAGGCELSGADLTGARLRRVLFDGGRLAGTQFIDAELDDVVFRNCKLTLATFHSSRLREVVFSGCELDEAFLGRGTMQSVRFEDCRLLRADFSGAILKRVDLRGSELDPAGDVGGLRGAIIDSAQLAGLAGQLAHAAGIRVDED